MESFFQKKVVDVKSEMEQVKGQRNELTEALLLAEVSLSEVEGIEISGQPGIADPNDIPNLNE